MNVDMYRSQSVSWKPAAYQTSYERFGANIFNFYVTDPNFRNWLLTKISRRNVEVPAQDIYWYKDVYVSADTIIYDQNRQALDVSLRDQPTVPTLSQPFDTIEEITEPAAFIFKAGKDNYGHVLVEMLPKLEHLIASGICPIKLLVPKLNKNLFQILQEIVTELYRGSFELRKMNSNIAKVHELIVPGPVTRHNDQKSFVVAKFGARIKERWQQANVQRRSIYVSRANVLNRRMENELEIEQLAVEAGFSIVRPETMSFADQVAIFSSAERVLGPLGAALSNILFCDPATHIMMIDSGMCDLFFYDLASLQKQVFSWVFTQQIGFFDAKKLHGDYRVDKDLVKQAIKMIWDR